MRSKSRSWLFFVVGVLTLLVVMAYISRVVIEGDEDAARARIQVEHSAKERTALWRIDSALSPLLANETGRSIASAVRLPVSYGPPPKFFSLFFSSDRAGRISGYGPNPELSAAELNLIKTLDLKDLRAGALNDPIWLDPANQSVAQNISTMNGLVANASTNFYNNDRDIRVQRRILTNSLNPMANVVNVAIASSALMPYTGFWAKNEEERHLVLVRPQGMEDAFHFVLVDWQQLFSWLEEHVADVLPDAKIEAVTSAAEDESSALLAELPIKLVSSPNLSPIPTSRRSFVLLGAVWAAVLLALLCIGLVLFVALRISDRRARFVSTVTHELRTPITTFRMYSQMLSDGMIKDPKKTSEYLQTLKEESERISRVLESVLLYSRIEEGGGEARLVRISVDELLEGLLRPMSHFATAREMELDVNFEDAQNQWVETDAQVIEQIVSNLLENAAKYARPWSNKVEIKSTIDGGNLVIDVSDHGPGIKPGEEKIIFQEFRRGQGHEADGFSGLGLGLALGRELSRGLGGDLTLMPVKPAGAHFRLTLPIVR